MDYENLWTRPRARRCAGTCSALPASRLRSGGTAPRGQTYHQIRGPGLRMSPNEPSADSKPELTANLVPFGLSGIQLAEWQRRAVDAWATGDGTARFRGTLEVFTG